jgi:uncharacterized membrane protein YtjA (UPF0391 family)
MSDPNRTKEQPMLSPRGDSIIRVVLAFAAILLCALFFAIAIGLAMFGFRGAAETASDAAKFLCVTLMITSVTLLLGDLLRRRRIGHDAR